MCKKSFAACVSSCRRICGDDALVRLVRVEGSMRKCAPAVPRLVSSRGHCRCCLHATRAKDVSSAFASQSVEQ